jgi:YD repeat-containing protein
MKIYQLVLLFVLMFLYNEITGQTASIIDRDYPGASADELNLSPYYDVFPPTPGAALLGKYGDHPVSLSTGLPDISIPLFDIGTTRIKLPISISYHASGIRIEELPSSVGLGWVLNAGGCIARTVKGAADKEGFSCTYTENYINGLYDKLFGLFLAYDDAGMGMDLESDLYSYNFNGYSGQFCYNNRGEIVPLTKDGLKISKTSMGYAITTPDGIRYVFDIITKSLIERNSDLTLGYYRPSTDFSKSDNGSDYYLSLIEDLMTGEKITFDYKQLQLDTNNEKGYVYYPRFDGLQKIYVFTPGDAFNGLPDMLAPDEPGYLRIDSDQLMLCGITFPGGKVKIINDLNCEDMRLFRVSEIKLYSYLNTVRESINKVKFHYDYFSSYSKVAFKGKRLRLDGITMDDTKKYSFKYDSRTLPPYYNWEGNHDIGCFSQDEWGYYNGKSNKTLFQNLPVPHKNLIADRSSDTGYMKACSLYEIVYPTGGKTRFELEANMVGKTAVGGLRIKNILSYVDKDDKKPIRTTSYIYPNGGIMSPLYNTKYQNWQCTQYYDFASAGVDRATYACIPIIRVLTNYGTSPMVSNRHHNGNVVYYDKVIETIYNSDNIEQERNIYSYYVNERDAVYAVTNNILNTDARFYGAPPYESYMSVRNYSSGHLLKQEQQVYDATKGEFIKQREIENQYATFGKQKDTIGFIVMPSRIFIYSDCNREADNNIDFQYFDIFAESGIKKITKTITTEYFGNNISKSDTVIFDYDPKYYNLVKQETRKSSDNKTITTQTTYPFDYLFTPLHLDDRYVYNAMRTKNIVDIPIERVIKVNGKIVYAYGSTYSTDNESIGQMKFLKCSDFKLNASTPIDDYLALSFVKSDNSYILDPRCTVEAQYSYYPNGKLKEIIQPKNNDTITILWGYNFQYPIAEIKNASRSQVSQAISNVFGKSPQALSSQKTPDETKLINGSLQTALPDALVTTYTYKPLVGITSKTDPHGETVYYTYDSAGRLSVIKDKDRKNVKSYIYKYKQQ